MIIHVVVVVVVVVVVFTKVYICTTHLVYVNIIVKTFQATEGLS